MELICNFWRELREVKVIEHNYERPAILSVALCRCTYWLWLLKAFIWNSTVPLKQTQLSQITQTQYPKQSQTCLRNRGQLHVHVCTFVHGDGRMHTRWWACVCGAYFCARKLEETGMGADSHFSSSVSIAARSAWQTLTCSWSANSVQINCVATR